MEVEYNETQEVLVCCCAHFKAAASCDETSIFYTGTLICVTDGALSLIPVTFNSFVFSGTDDWNI
jgi:hypothetical protein